MEVSEAEWTAMKEQVANLEQEVAGLQADLNSLVASQAIWAKNVEDLIKGFRLLSKSPLHNRAMPKPTTEPDR